MQLTDARDCGPWGQNPACASPSGRTHNHGHDREPTRCFPDPASPDGAGFAPDRLDGRSTGLSQPEQRKRWPFPSCTGQPHPFTRNVREAQSYQAVCNPSRFVPDLCDTVLTTSLAGHRALVTMHDGALIGPERARTTFSKRTEWIPRFGSPSANTRYDAANTRLPTEQEKSTIRASRASKDTPATA